MERERIINPLLDRVSELYKRLDALPLSSIEKREQIENTIMKFKAMINRRFKSKQH